MLGCWWVEFEIRNMLEMAGIVGEEGQIVMQGCGANQDIKISDEFPSPPISLLKNPYLNCSFVQGRV